MKRVSPKFIHIDRLTDCRRRRRRLWRLLALPRPPAPHSLRSAVSVGSTCLHVFVTHVYLHEKEITPHTWPEQADSPSSPPSGRHTHLSLCNQIVRKGMKSYFYTWAHTRSRHCLGEVRARFKGGALIATGEWICTRIWPVTNWLSAAKVAALATRLAPLPFLPLSLSFTHTGAGLLLMHNSWGRHGGNY